MIHLIVGNTGSGKTTYGLHLKKKIGGVIFSIDQWNKTLFLMDKTESDGLTWFLERIERAETIITNLILQLNDAGVDAILDLGLSKKSHRDKFRAFAEANQIECRLHFLDIPKEVRRQRIIQRNLDKGETFEFKVSEVDFEFMETWFETPTAEELSNAVIVNA